MFIFKLYVQEQPKKLYLRHEIITLPFVIIKLTYVEVMSIKIKQLIKIANFM